MQNPIYAVEEEFLNHSRVMGVATRNTDTILQQANYNHTWWEGEYRLNLLKPLSITITPSIPECMDVRFSPELTEIIEIHGILDDDVNGGDARMDAFVEPSILIDAMKAIRLRGDETIFHTQILKKIGTNYIRIQVTSYIDGIHDPPDHNMVDDPSLITSIGIVIKDEEYTNIIHLFVGEQNVPTLENTIWRINEPKSDYVSETWRKEEGRTKDFFYDNTQQVRAVLNNDKTVYWMFNHKPPQSVRHKTRFNETFKNALSRRTLERIDKNKKTRSRIHSLPSDMVNHIGDYLFTKSPGKSPGGGNRTKKRKNTKRKHI